MNYSRFFFYCVGRLSKLVHIIKNPSLKMWRKKIICILMSILVICSYFHVTATRLLATDEDTDIDVLEVDTSDLGITSKACVLMEASTGTVIYEKAKDERLSPASITKIMTLILIFEAIDSGQITLDEEVTTSAYAKSMGGSQVFLEEGEKQTVETLIKCIVVASGNDACVTMAEHIAGSESEFVARMNKKAEALGMVNTHFEDSCGLSDSDNHYTSAYDVALMSRELITKHPDIFKYSTIWMENITHITNKGESEFGLANTNKLLKQYQYATGLKTGSTSKAKYCVSATAKKDDIELIAVIMAAPDYKLRFSEAETLLKYGYGVCNLYSDKNDITLESQPVKGGVKDEVKCVPESGFSYITTDGTPVDKVEKTITYKEKIMAPIDKGTIIGKITYTLNGKEIGNVNIITSETVEKAGFGYSLKKLFEAFLL